MGTFFCFLFPPSLLGFFPPLWPFSFAATTFFPTFFDGVASFVTVRAFNRLVVSGLLLGCEYSVPVFDLFTVTSLPGFRFESLDDVCRGER